MDPFLEYLQGAKQDFQPYAAGNKRYGAGLRSAPNIGPVTDRLGYRERDLKAAAMRNAMLRRMQSAQTGNFFSSAYMNPAGRSF